MNLVVWSPENYLALEQSSFEDVERAAYAILISGQSIDPKNRPIVWSLLLGQASSDVIAADSHALPLVILNNANQRTINVDAARTRQELEVFRSSDAVRRVECILTYYCHRAGVRYKQGLNELLAPIMLVFESSDVPYSDAASFHLLSRVVRHFAPRFYASDDAEFVSLQCSFRLFRLLVLYHDPTLASILDQYELPPELYASPWFLTLFARNHSNLAIVFSLWDFLFACARSPGPEILHFVALAFLQRHKSIVMETAQDNLEVAELPMKLSKLTFESLEDVRAVCKSALDLYANSPRSLKVLLHNVGYSIGGSESGACNMVGPFASYALDILHFPTCTGMQLLPLQLVHLSFRVLRDAYVAKFLSTRLLQVQVVVSIVKGQWVVAVLLQVLPKAFCVCSPLTRFNSVPRDTFLSIVAAKTRCEADDSACLLYYAIFCSMHAPMFSRTV